MKFKKKKLGWGTKGEGSGLGGQGGCDRRIEKFLGKFTKKNFRGGGVGLGGGGGGGVRLDVNEELKFLCKFKKKKKLWGGGGGQGCGVWGGGGVRVDENEELKFL